MNVLLVRHAAAEEHSPAGDQGRRLTPSGREEAQRAFGVLARHYDTIDLILTSQAVRAKETAALLSNALGHAEVVESALLNPGCDFDGFKKVLSALALGKQRIAVVGHEPDLSHIIARIIGDGVVHVAMKKAACAEVELQGGCKGVLRLLIPPAAAVAMGAHAEL